MRQKSLHIWNPMLLYMGAWGPLFWVLFVVKRRKIHRGCPSLEGSSSPWRAQRGIDAWNSFGFFPRASRVYFEKIHRSSKQREVIKWARVPPSYQHFLRSSWVRSHRAPVLGVMLPASPFPLQPGPLLARLGLQLCCPHPALCLLPQSDLLVSRLYLLSPISSNFPLWGWFLAAISIFMRIKGFPGSVCSLLPTVSSPMETPLI